MNRKKHHLLQLLLPFITAVFLLTGCFSDNTSETAVEEASETSSEASITESAAEYETYTKASIQMQKDFDAFTDEIFLEDITDSLLNLHFLIINPAEFGITDYPKTFGEFSAASVNEDILDMKAVKTQLSAFDISQLTDQQKLTWRILNSYLDTNLQGEGFELYLQPLAPTIGVQAQLPVLLSEYSFYQKQDVEDYLELLSQIDEYFDQILIFEQEKAENGLLFSNTSIQHIIDSCNAYIADPETSFLKETFETRLDTVPGLSEEEKESYKAQNLDTLKNSFIPAYENLVHGMEALKSPDNVEGGMCNLPNGKKFYQFLVNSTTNTSYNTIGELRSAIEKQMDKDLTEATKILTSNPDIYEEVNHYRFSPSEPEEILKSLEKELEENYPALPECSYTIKYVPEALEGILSPAFYLVPAIDRYQNNVIYINNGSSADSLYTTLAHEGFPGHMYQNVYFYNTEPEPIRHLLSFGSYSEGWATYVEMDSYSFDNGLSQPLGKLLAHNQASVTGLHAMLDININYYNWGKEEVKNYLSKFYENITDEVVDSIYYTMIENPGNYLEYYVGYLEIIDMRNYAEESMGEKFNLKDFHTFLLDIGPAPFDVIRGYLQSWVTTQKMK